MGGTSGIVAIGPSGWREVRIEADAGVFWTAGRRADESLPVASGLGRRPKQAPRAGVIFCSGTNGPGFAALICACLLGDEDGETYTLIWLRPSGKNGY